jgi:hypothetical protein
MRNCARKVLATSPPPLHALWGWLRRRGAGNGHPGSADPPIAHLDSALHSRVMVRALDRQVILAFPLACHPSQKPSISRGFVSSHRQYIPD